jgi:3-phosphoglycerate kinase
MLKELSNIYVNDAFRTAHRAHFNYNHYSIFPTGKCFGLLLAKELKFK